MIKPNFLIIGARKCGTTSLYHYLKQHPQIFMPARKEPNFFSGSMSEYSSYQKLFAAVRQEIAIGEASTSYLHNPNSVKNIKRFFPNIKIIVMLRNPVDRAYAQFAFSSFRHLKHPAEFVNMVEKELPQELNDQMFLYGILKQSLYFKQLKPYFDHFDRSKIKICLLEDLQKDPQKLTQDIFRFLGVQDDFVPDTSYQYNRSGVPENRMFYTLWKLLWAFGKKLDRMHIPRKDDLQRCYINKSRRMFQMVVRDKWEKPPLPEYIRKDLLAVFWDDIIKLEALVQRDLSFWRKA